MFKVHKPNAQKIKGRSKTKEWDGDYVAPSQK